MRFVISVLIVEIGKTLHPVLIENQMEIFIGNVEGDIDMTIAK